MCIKKKENNLFNDIELQQLFVDNDIELEIVKKKKEKEEKNVYLQTIFK